MAYVNGLVLAQLEIRVRGQALVLVNAEGGVEAALSAIRQDAALRLRRERAILFRERQAAVAAPSQDVHVAADAHLRLTVRALLDVDAAERKRYAEI